MYDYASVGRGVCSFFAIIREYATQLAHSRTLCHFGTSVREMSGV